MKRKIVHKKKAVATHHSSSSRALKRSDDKYVILVRSWIFLVLFAIMLGVGIIVGSYINNQLNGGSPMVAGASTGQ